MQAIVLQSLNKPRPALDMNDVERLMSTKAINEAIKEISAKDIEGLAKLIAGRFTEIGDAHNRSQFKRNMARSLGIDISSALLNDQVKDKIALAVEENVSLIQSIQNGFIDDIGKIMRENTVDGFRHEDLIQLIKDRGQVTESRAKLIARDQTAKFNAAITQARSEAVGARYYIWDGADDERERDSHRVLNGLLCDWRDPTIYSDDWGKTWKKRSAIKAYIGHPGEDYQCRCNAIPYFNWD